MTGNLSFAAETDVAIVGAGAAGIAAARRIAAAGRRAIVLEASGRIGGRCITDMSLFGMPCDLGAHWLHEPDSNPVARLAPGSGFEIYPAPPGQKMRIGRRNAREGELEQYLATLMRARRAIEDAARGKSDMSLAQALPKDLGEWGPSVDFYLGPFECGKDPAVMSAVDFVRSNERNIDAYCRQGYGALLSHLANGVTVQLATPVTKIDTQPRGAVSLETGKGSLRARAVIVTASTNALLDGQLEFAPGVPKRMLDALDRLRLGHYERIIMNMPGNPLELSRDDLVFEKADDRRTAMLLGNAGGSPLAYVDVGGSFARDLAARGPREMTAFAVEWVEKLFGGDVAKAVARSHATQWSATPHILGSFSAASVGGHPSRRILMEPLLDRVYYAGEAAHETMWGTVGGAWESGERAADAVLKIVAAPAPATIAPAQKRRAPQRQPQQRRPIRSR